MFSDNLFIGRDRGCVHPSLVGTSGIRMNVKSLKRLIENKYHVTSHKVMKPREQYGVVSAERHSLPRNVNAKRTRMLGCELQSAGFKPVEATGYFKEAKDMRPLREHSFIVPKLPLADTEFLGNQFGQEGVLENNVYDDLGKRNTELVFSGRTKFGDAALEQPARTVIKYPYLSYSLQPPVKKVHEPKKIFG